MITIKMKIRCINYFNNIFTFFIPRATIVRTMISSNNVNMPFKGLQIIQSIFTIWSTKHNITKKIYSIIWFNYTIPARNNSFIHFLDRFKPARFINKASIMIKMANEDLKLTRSYKHHFLFGEIIASIKFIPFFILLYTVLRVILYILHHSDIVCLSPLIRG